MQYNISAFLSGLTPNASCLRVLQNYDSLITISEGDPEQILFSFCECDCYFYELSEPGWWNLFGSQCRQHQNCQFPCMYGIPLSCSTVGEQVRWRMLLTTRKRLFICGWMAYET